MPLTKDTIKLFYPSSEFDSTKICNMISSYREENMYTDESLKIVNLHLCKGFIETLVEIEANNEDIDIIVYELSNGYEYNAQGE